jgi:magnesium-transporting ATPase (P-type)
MVGDGINDAPVSSKSVKFLMELTVMQALAAADVAIAIGSGSDVALSSASFVLVSSDLGSILTLVDLSATVFRRVKLNFVCAHLTRCTVGQLTLWLSSCGHWCIISPRSRSQQEFYTPSDTFGSVQSGLPLPWHCRK